MSDSSADDTEMLDGGNAPATDANDASGSSTEATDTGAESMLDAVKAALTADSEEASPPSEPTDSTQPKSPEAEKSATDTPDKDALSEAEMKALKPKVAKRINDLLNDRRTLTADRDGLKQKAADFDRVYGFAQRNNLTPDDLNSGFEIMAAMKNNPAKAWEMLQPIVGELQRIVGDGPLPNDLAERVRLGYLTEQDARELAKAKSQVRLRDDQAQAQAERDQEARIQQETQTLITNVAQAASTWERQKAASDPDWNLKANRINELVRLTVHEKGYPKNSDEVVERLNSIHADVTKELRKLNPKPRAMAPVTGSSSNPRSVSEPKTFLEAVQQGLSRTAA